MKAYLINLDRNSARFHAMRERFSNLGVEFERFPACDGGKLSAAEINEFKSLRPGGFWEQVGKIGCFKSHFSLWEIIAQGPDRDVAIFEDDLHISDDLPLFLDGNIPPVEADIIRLETTRNRALFRGQAISWNGRTLRRLNSSASGNGAYILSKEGARKILSYPPDIHLNSDLTPLCLERSPIARSLKTFQVYPGLCIQDKFFHKDVSKIVFKSDIEPNGFHIQKIPLAHRFVRAAYNTVRGYKRVHFR